MNRARRRVGQPRLNHKRVFRLVRLAYLVAQPCTGRRAVPAQEGVVIAPTSKQRWASDGVFRPDKSLTCVRRDG